MKKAIEQENWAEVKKILQQHDRGLDKESPKVQHDLSDIGHRISQYTEDLEQISRMLTPTMKRGSDNKIDMLIKVESAINQAYFFEQTILHLIKERKFMK
ncbi:MAG TPA: hypothetical protein VJI32_03535 [Candidatus Nanoarchaeia archaeon]|nr:hypothetical protein [Candidatus Nanoarchaeia archaeon]